jgi:branched-chain amino acid transport system permease protein
VAGYALALFDTAGEPISLWWSLPASVGVSALLASASSDLVVRTHGIYFIMVTMAFSQWCFMPSLTTRPWVGLTVFYMTSNRSFTF